MFIDMHVHTACRPLPPRPDGTNFASPEQLIEAYDQLGIERGVVLPEVNPECSYGTQSNEEIIDLCRRNDRFIPFCNMDPRFMTNMPDAPLGDILRHYKAQGCKGVGEVCANLPFLDPMVQNLFKHCQDAGMPLIFHIAPYVGGYYGLYDDPGLPQLEQCLQRFPELKLLGHSQPFWAEIAELETVGERVGRPPHAVEREGAVPKLMRKYPNLLGDLSAGSGHHALARDEDYAPKFLTEFQDRLFFGTDICAPSCPRRLVDLLIKFRDTGKVTAEVFEKVARENARRLLGLDRNQGENKPWCESA